MLQSILDADLLLSKDVLNFDTSPRYSYKFNPLPVNPTKKQKKIKHVGRDQDDPYNKKVEGVQLFNGMSTILHPLFTNTSELSPTRA